MLKLDNVLMIDRSVNFDFTHQFLLSAALRQRGFYHNFGSLNVLSLLVNEFIAFGESPLAKEFSFEILLDLNFSIVLYNLFFYDNWRVAFHL